VILYVIHVTIFISNDTGILPSLLKLMCLNITSNRKISSSSTTATSIIAASEEICWLFAFLTAKDDNRVLHYLVVDLNIIPTVSQVIMYYIKDIMRNSSGGVNNSYSCDHDNNENNPNRIDIDGVNITNNNKSIAIIPLLRCLGNITSCGSSNNINSGRISGNDGSGDYNHNNNIETILLSFINNNNQLIFQCLIALTSCMRYYILNPIVKESLWVICNILASSQTRALFLDYKYSSNSNNVMDLDNDQYRLTSNNNNIDDYNCFDSILGNILYLVKTSDDFHIQQEAIFCLEQACIEYQTINIILQSFYYHDVIQALCRLLDIPGSIEVPMACIRIFNALITGL